MVRTAMSVAVCCLLLPQVLISAQDGAGVVKKSPSAAVKLTLIGESGTQWQIPGDAAKVSVLVVGGGGGGAPGLGTSGGGGGAGGLVYVDDYLTICGGKPGQTVKIQAGFPGEAVGLARGRRGFRGEDSVFGIIVAFGGGGGGRAREEGHRATPGGSGGGGVEDEAGRPAAAIQPKESGPGYGFGHIGGGGEAGSGGGGAGGPGTLRGQGGGGPGLQGIPLDRYVDHRSGYVLRKFDAADLAHYKILFRDVFGAGIGDDGWFAGGGTHNSRSKTDKGGRGGGSTHDGMPHTGGGGGGSTHNFEGSAPGIGGSGVVYVRCLHRNGSTTVLGWGRLQTAAMVLRKPLYLRDQCEFQAAIAALDQIENVDLMSVGDRASILRAYGQLYAAQGQEEMAAEKFKEANQLEAATRNQPTRTGRSRRSGRPRR